MDGKRNASSLRWIHRGLLGLWLIVPGCGWLGGEAEEQAGNDVVIPGLDDINSDQDEAEGEPIPVAPEGRNLALKLKVGDRFPLQKTVQQSVTQSSAEGNLTSESLLEMMLEINVEEVQPDRTRMQVRYHRIRYYQNVDGERVVYDSEKDTHALDPSVAAYHGMVNNGFSFWVGPQNGIQELVGFEDFLKRCFRSITPAERQAALNRIASSTGDQGVANFIDDSIGLLPYGAEEESDGKSGIAAGDVWTRARRVELPLPMQISDKCLISDLNDKIATIDIHGTIGPVTNAIGPASSEQQSMQVEIRGGTSTGQCLIDRDSGLPIQSKIERIIDMNVRLESGEQLAQQKQIVTTI
ncbi:MAG: DUF6263 family protein, partial [Planctomycetaceae bacterium]